MIRSHIGSLRHFTPQGGTEESPGDLYSMQYEIISSETTGGVPVYKHPGTDKECPALSVKYETKKADRK